MVWLRVKAGDDFVTFNEALDLQSVLIGRTAAKTNQIGSELILEALGWIHSGLLNQRYEVVEFCVGSLGRATLGYAD